MSINPQGAIHAHTKEERCVTVEKKKQTLERVLCLEEEDPELLLESSIRSGACLKTSHANESGYPNSRIIRFWISA